MAGDTAEDRDGNGAPTRLGGFSLVELMVVVAILGVLTAISLQVSDYERRRDQVDGAARELAGWLQAVRRSAERGEGCLVTITETGAASASTDVAQANTDIAGGATGLIPNHCLMNSPLRFESGRGAGAVSYGIDANGNRQFVFTPRGSLFKLDGNQIAPVQISIVATNGGNAQPPLRCVLITPPLGRIEVVANQAAAGGVCR